jgi:hypothetical protein
MPVFRSKIESCFYGKRTSAVACLGSLALLACFFCLTPVLASKPADPISVTDSRSLSAPDRASSDLSSPDYTSDRIAATVPEQVEDFDESSRYGLNGQLQADFPKNDLRRRPLLYFRMWANKPLPPVLSFLFLLFISIVASEVMPSRMDVARRYYATHYWRSLWSGIVACLLFVTLARALFASEIGLPLAIVSLAALELFVLIGVAISSTLVGQTILSVFSRKQAAPIKRQWFERLAAPLLGSFLLSLLLLIPPLGILPRIGIRLIMLLSFLGMGAWFRTGMGTKDVGSASET